MNPLRNGILAWANAASDDTVIWKDGNGPSPSLPFMAIKILAVAREGMPTYFPLDDDGSQPILQGALLTVSCSVFDASQLEALNEAERLVSTLNRTTVKDALRDHGLAFVDVLLAPTDTSVVVGTEFESRASFDIRFRANMRDDDPIGWIEFVELTGEIDTGLGVLVITKTIGVN